MDNVANDVWEVVERIIGSGAQIGLAATGGGSVAVSWLVNHPGASRTVVEAQIPYHVNALQDFLQVKRALSAEAETARQMACRAYSRASGLGTTSNDNPKFVGVGCTAALTTVRERLGSDRAFIATRTEETYEITSLAFAKEKAGRREQEQILSRAILASAARACRVSAPEGVEQFPAWIEVGSETLPVLTQLEELLRGKREVMAWNPSARSPGLRPIDASHRERQLLLSGSFNPQHDGHLELARAAADLSGRSPVLELSTVNVDKPSLSYRDVVERLHSASLPVFVTDTATFREKARRFPGCHFAIGYDTAVRLLDPRYYGGSVTEVEAVLGEFAKGECRFYVAGRLHEDRFATVDDLHVPETFAHMFVEIPEEVFRHDISSSSIRAGTATWSGKNHKGQ